MRAKHVLRSLVVALLALVAALVPGSVAGAVPPSQCTLFPGFFSPLAHLNANWVGRFNYSVPAGSDSVSGAATVDGYPGWAAFMDNHTGSPVTQPRVTVSSGLDPAVFDGGLMTPTFPSSCSLPSLPAGNQMQIFPGINATGLHSSFSLGYDSSRSVSPTVVPVGGADVTVQFAVRLTDPRYAGGAFVSLFVGQGGGPVTLLSQSSPTNLDQGENASTNPGSFNLGNAQLGKTYVFTAVFHVANPPFGQPVGPWTWTPGAQIYVNSRGTGCAQCGVTASSVTITDPSLDGSQPGSGAVTFGVDETDRTWDVTTQTQYVTEYQGGLFPNLSAQVSSGVGAGVSAATDSVASGTSLDGGWFWGFDIGNFSQPPSTVPNPTITVGSGYAASQFHPDFGPPASSLPIVRSAPSLPNGSDLQLQLGSEIPATVQPGCDTSRSASPLSVPAGGGQQTFTFTIRCVDPGVTNVNGGFQVGLPGATLVSFAGPSNLNQGEGLNGPPNSWFGAPGDVHAGVGFGVENLVTGKQYTFTFVVQTPNPFGVEFAQKPDTGIVEELPQPNGCMGCGGARTSVSVAEPTLDGPTPGAGVVTFSVGDARIWTVRVSHNRKVDYGGTQQRTLSYAGPASGTDGQPVMLDAHWDGFKGHAGTPVTFTLGSQSCTVPTGTATSDQDAACTLTLAQPVGVYTLVVSSPGDVGVYPASTSAPFSITGPTGTDQCKKDGWQVFGIFKNQGDCVSNVATKGKNPPNG